MPFFRVLPSIFFLAFFFTEFSALVWQSREATAFHFSQFSQQASAFRLECRRFDCRLSTSSRRGLPGFFLPSFLFLPILLASILTPKAVETRVPSFFLSKKRFCNSNHDSLYACRISSLPSFTEFFFFKKDVGLAILGSFLALTATKDLNQWFPFFFQF